MSAPSSPKLAPPELAAPELVCIGRTCVDLYGEQIGAPLEDVQSFQMYVGGSASNICIGTARLGVRSAMIARVGDEPFGRFVRRTFLEEGVDVRHVTFDRSRLTALIALAIRKCDDFPRIFYYENAADMGLSVDQIDSAFVASCGALLVTGTHFSQPGLDAASRQAMRAARDAGRRVAFDIDYRPVLWGLAGHADGQQMFASSDRVSAHLQTILPACQLVVGTEEEICIAGGSPDLQEALRTIRRLTKAPIVRKRGAQGSIVYAEAIPDDLEQGIAAAPFPVEVFNATGAGDAFMSGFLSGWLRDESLERCCELGNACGAIVVSRHGCSAAMPSAEELRYFLAARDRPPRLREDAALVELHRIAGRKASWPQVNILAFDHRWQFEAWAAEAKQPRSSIVRAKELIAAALSRTAANRPGIGALIDDQYGSEALERLTGQPLWLGRPIEAAGQYPLQFVGGPNVASTLRGWPGQHVAKCLVFIDNRDQEGLEQQEQLLLQLQEACHELGRELLVELLPRQAGDEESAFDAAATIERLYRTGLRPDWWKLENLPKQAQWDKVGRILEAHDSHCRGVVVLGKNAPLEELAVALREARRHACCRGFAVGRTIFANPVKAWLAGTIDDERLTDQVRENLMRLVEAWDEND